MSRQCKQKAKLLFCTTREATDKIELVCRFTDGQRIPIITVDGRFPDVADLIRDLINGEKGIKT